MVNSGSSANLLALSSFNFKKGSEIITPNLTFSTTVAPISVRFSSKIYWCRKTKIHCRYKSYRKSNK